MLCLDTWAIFFSWLQHCHYSRMDAQTYSFHFTVHVVQLQPKKLFLHLLNIMCSNYVYSQTKETFCNTYQYHQCKIAQVMSCVGVRMNRMLLWSPWLVCCRWQCSWLEILITGMNEWINQSIVVVPILPSRSCSFWLICLLLSYCHSCLFVDDP